MVRGTHSSRDQAHRTQEIFYRLDRFNQFLAGEVSSCQFEGLYRHFSEVLAEDGQILVDKNSKYQWEKGQWENPESFLKLI